MPVTIMPLAPGNLIQKFVTMLWKWWGRRELKRKWQKQNVGGVAVIHMRLLLTEVVRGTLLSLSSEQNGFHSPTFSSPGWSLPAGILEVIFGTFMCNICDLHSVSICIHIRHGMCWVIVKTQGQETITRKMTKQYHVGTTGCTWLSWFDPWAGSYDCSSWIHAQKIAAWKAFVLLMRQILKDVPGNMTDQRVCC